jgi:hypothetical protein
MTTKELIEKLNEMPQDAKVAVYCAISEDSDMAHKVELLSKREGPYNKADDVWFMYGFSNDEKIVFIR